MTFVVERFFDTNGDGSGITDGAVDYSGGAQEFYIQPPSTDTWRFNKLIMYASDTTLGASTLFINQTALTNGLTFRRWDGSAATNYTAAVKTNNLIFTEFDITEVKRFNFTSGFTEEFVIATLFLQRSTQWLDFDGSANERLSVTLNDDLSTLLSLRFFAEGYSLD